MRRTSPIVVSWALELVGGQGLSMMSRVISELMCCSLSLRHGARPSGGTGDPDFSGV